MKRSSKGTRSINIFFLRIFVPIVMIFGACLSLFLAWNDYQVNLSSRLESQDLIFRAFLATIRQPLLQGSLVEAEIRAAELVKNRQVGCVEIQSQMNRIGNCDHMKNEGPGLHLISRPLFF